MARRVLITRLPRVSLIVTLPASESRKRTRAPRVTRETCTALSVGAVSSTTSSVVGAGKSFGNGCSLSGGGGGGGGLPTRTIPRMGCAWSSQKNS